MLFCVFAKHITRDSLGPSSSIFPETLFVKLETILANLPADAGEAARVQTGLLTVIGDLAG